MMQLRLTNAFAGTASIVGAVNRRPAWRRLTVAAALATAMAGAWAQPDAPTPAQVAIAALEKAIAANPARADLHGELAVAFARRARETSDTLYYERADAAAAKALELSPGDLSGERARIWVKLGKHEFADALALAQALNKRIPDDVLTYGFLVDANAELGRYAAAEEAAQWMLDLRPGNIPAFARAAYLRELFGDVEGAMQLMDAALERTAPNETEDRAWLLTQMAHLEIMRGGIERADQLLAQALALYADYHYALANLARVRLIQQRANEAVDLLYKRYVAAPHPENLYALAEARAAAGQTAQANLDFAEFERRALAESEKWDNANRELIHYYVDWARRPDEALRIAQREVERRRDVFTLDAYAWALHANGRHLEARAAIDELRAVGIREPAILYRAAVVTEAAGDRTVALTLVEQSLDAARRSEVAARAESFRARLREMAGKQVVGEAATARP